MRKPDWKSCKEEELWIYVATHLARNGVETVMVGGSVVSVYTGGLYQSGDIDLVRTGVAMDRLKELLAEIGFKSKGRLFAHPQCRHIYLDFPLGPVALGNDYKIKPVERKVGKLGIKLLSPTDCIKDRLASYMYFNARECLDQAAMVGRKQKVNVASIKLWCGSEGRPEVFKEWKRLVDDGLEN